MRKPKAADGAAPIAAQVTPPAPAPTVSPPPPKPKSPAEWAYDRIAIYIRNFETHLDAQHEIAMGFAGSDAGILKIEGLGFYDPDILSFYGIDENGAKTQLIQHVTQLSVMLRAVPKSVPAAPPRRIGFRLQPGWPGGESGDGSA